MTDLYTLVVSDFNQIFLLVVNLSEKENSGDILLHYHRHEKEGSFREKSTLYLQPRKILLNDKIEREKFNLQEFVEKHGLEERVVKFVSFTNFHEETPVKLPSLKRAHYHYDNYHHDDYYHEPFTDHYHEDYDLLDHHTYDDFHHNEYDGYHIHSHY